MSMSSIKCKNCGLKNFAYENACKRCGEPFHLSAKSKSVRPRRFSLSSLLIIAFVGGFAYYANYGLQSSADDIYAKELKRLEEQKQDKTAGLSRTQYEKQRSGTYGAAVQNSNSIAAHNDHLRETEKAEQAATSATPAN